MKSSLRKKIGATIVALGIGVLASVAIPMSASAHTGSVKAAASCITTTGAGTVTFSVKNDYTTEMDIAASDNTAIPVGTKIAAGDTATFDDKIAAPAAGKTSSATLTYHWASDGYTQPADANDYAEATVDKGCTATQPPTDCIAATWLIAGGDANVPFANGAQTLQTSAKVDCTSNPPTPPTTCGTAYQVDIYNDNQITTDLINGGKLYASGKPAESLYSASSFKVTQNPACSTTTKIAPDVKFTDQCGIANDTITPTLVDHVSYVTTTDSRVNGVGHVVVTATADKDYVFPNGKTTQEFPADFTDTACTTSVSVEPAVTFDDQCGTANDTFATTPITHITYTTKSDSVVNGSRVVVITATADNGFTFPDGKTTTKDYTQTFTDVACPVTPPTPTSIAPAVVFTDVCGVTGDTITPTAADHITYDTTTGDARVNGVGTVTVTATADAGYAFPDGTTSATFTGTFTDAACAVTPPVTPPVVTPPTVAPPVVSPPVVKPIVSAPTTPSTTPRVEAPSGTTPTVLASTGMNESTPIAGELALGALAIGSVLVAVGAVRRRRATTRS